MSSRLVTLAAGACMAVGVLALEGCGSNEDCIILANGGNKLCGDDARAWCDTTDSIRSAADGLSDDPTIDDSQAACDTIRSQ
jgi:hypothetical protein